MTKLRGIDDVTVGSILQYSVTVCSV